MTFAPASTLLDSFDLNAFIQATLAEDLGTGGDVTSAATIPAGAKLAAVIAAREGITVAGLAIAEDFFMALDPEVRVERHASDGETVAAGAILLRLEGGAHAVLAAERSALNTLQHLSGVATQTRVYAEVIADTGCRLLDTRKTIPGLRVLEKYAAAMGGAHNHRIRLDDGILIKDNHIGIVGGVSEAVAAAKRAGTGLEVQVEVDRLDQIGPALAAGADRLLCDNMSVEELRAAVALVGGRVPIEASGGIRLDTIRSVAETGVTYISVGRITQSAPAVDIGLDYATV